MFYSNYDHVSSLMNKSPHGNTSKLFWMDIVLNSDDMRAGLVGLLKIKIIQRRKKDLTIQNCYLL